MTHPLLNHFRVEPLTDEQCRMGVAKVVKIARPTNGGPDCRYDRDIKTTKALIRRAVTASDTTVTDVYGVGPIVAAFLIGYTGDPSRFATADHFAAYNATAPVEASSGDRPRHRLNPRGNRKLNHAIHMAAVTQIRFETPGRLYYDRKIAEGKTKKEAVRSLKRQVSDAVYHQLVVDYQRLNTR